VTPGFGIDTRERQFTTMSGIQSTSATGGLSPYATSDGSQSLRPFANLNLTEDQRTKIRAILQQAKSQGLSQADVQKQINGVLTTDQQKTLQSDLQALQQQQQTPPADPFANLNLTADQKTKIQGILQQAQSAGTDPSTVQQQINAILTPTQQATLQSDVQKAQSAHSGRHHHDGGGGSASSSSTSSSATDASTSTSVGTADPTTLANGLTATDIQNQAVAALAILAREVGYQATNSAG
jgi:Spy/CpxP family protein refolding chaperone